MSDQQPPSESAPVQDGPQPVPPTGPSPAYGSGSQPYGYPLSPPDGGSREFTSPSGQRSSAQPYSSQPYSTQPYSSQPYSNQPYPAQPYAGQPYAGQAYARQPGGSSGPGGPPVYGLQPRATVQPWPQTAFVRPRSDYAPWGRRVLALLIDRAPSIVASVVLMVAYVQALVILAQQGTNGSTAPDFSPVLVPLISGVALALAGLGWDIYNRWIVAGRTGQSLGKRVMKISLVSEQTGQPIGPLNAFCRDLVHILDGAAYVGYLWPLWDDKRQTFADMLMKTAVLNSTAGSPGISPH
jgi:uncharacterized RDD family membrane protein YckC